MVKLGERYKDTLTGFEGIATARTEYLYHCVRVGLEGSDKDKQPVEFWFDEQRLVDAKNKPVATLAKTGGARKTPPRTGLR